MCLNHRWEMLSVSEWDCIDNYLECMSTLHQVRHIDRSQPYAYLAVGSVPKEHGGCDKVPRRKKVVLRLGEAAEAGVWNREFPVLRRIKELLEVCDLLHRLMVEVKVRAACEIDDKSARCSVDWTRSTLGIYIISVRPGTASTGTTSSTIV